MQSYLSSGSKQTSKMPYRSIRSQYSHSHQERPRPPTGLDMPDCGVEFKGDILSSDTPKLIFGHVTNDSLKNSGPITPQHEENIRFISEEWQKVKDALENNTANQPRYGCVWYIEKDEFLIKDFKPFDLEEFWGQKLLHGVLGNDKKP